MKRIISVLAFSFLVLTVFSQQDSILRNKKGNIVLPQKGDFAIGISANPIFRYVGNMFSSNGENQLYLSPTDYYQINGKYFLSSKSAIRLKLGIHQSSKLYENNLVDDMDNSNKVTDKLNSSYTNFSFAAGYERRKGSGRLQVSYGAELNFYKYLTDLKYTYGNAISINNRFPTSTTDFENLSTSEINYRMLEIEKDNGIQIGIRAFAGLEYFIFSKISIGGEIGLGYSHNFNGKNKRTTEHWDFENINVTTDINDGNYSSSNINSDMLNEQIFLLFHF